jgi:hypothetical protein
MRMIRNVAFVVMLGAWVSVAEPSTAAPFDVQCGTQCVEGCCLYPVPDYCNNYCWGCGAFGGSLGDYCEGWIGFSHCNCWY